MDRQLLKQTNNDDYCIISLNCSCQLTFKLGLSFTPLAQAGLDALERWTASLPPHVLKPHLPEILPCLDGFLKTSAVYSKGINLFFVYLVARFFCYSILKCF